MPEPSLQSEAAANSANARLGGQRHELTRARRLQFAIAQLAAIGIILAIVVPAEIARLRENAAEGLSWWEWYVGMHVDTTLPAVLLVLLPIFWFVRDPLLRAGGRGARVVARWFGSERITENSSVDWRAWILALFVACCSILMSAEVARRFGGDLPPAYHDEYSYLLQAKTFLAGRTSWPSPEPAPEVFDQMHVLNDHGRFASRYFPGTGLWMAPFVEWGHPYWGHWLAGALSAFFMFWAGRELAGNLVGFVAGLLTALSPGMALFSNLLLAHHPGLVGLTLFLFTFLRLMRTFSPLDAVLAGVGLSWAMLCRPMTAAGFGLPFGIWLACWLLFGGRNAGIPFSRRFAGTAAVGIPVIAGLAALATYNNVITGSFKTTPYQLYTDVYTPRQRYGFNNVTIGEQLAGPKVMDSYDRWAANLTPELAVQNVEHRFMASLEWTLAIVPLAACVLPFFIYVVWTDRRWWLIPASIVSLHAVHVPYWYDGIMHYHYVFESGLLWILMFAGVTGAFVRGWRVTERPLMSLWWFGMTAAAIVPTYFAAGPFWPQSRLDNAVQTVAYPRRQYDQFHKLVAANIRNRPALVLIDHADSEPHLDYVSNDPTFDAEILFGRLRPGGRSLDEIASLFPERSIYVFDLQTKVLKAVPRLN